MVKIDTGMMHDQHALHIQQAAQSDDVLNGIPCHPPACIPDHTGAHVWAEEFFRRAARVEACYF